MRIISSVSLLVDIPEELAGSWYTNEVHVLFNDGTFEPSSPARHSSELAPILAEREREIERKRKREREYIILCCFCIVMEDLTTA